MENTAQENFGVKDDTFVRDVILPAIKDDTLYHGSSKKLSVIKPFQLKELRDKNVKTISLTPYARLASLFCVPFRSIRENSKGQVIFHHCRMKLDEWFKDMPEEELYKAVQIVHVSHNIKQLAPIDKTYTGYLHYVHADDALVDAGANPINGKGPYEVVSYVKELKPYKVEAIKIRMIAKYSPSFAKECGLDAEPCEPEDVATEDFSLEDLKSVTEEQTQRVSKLYFSTTDGKLPLDDNGNGLFNKNITDARIDAAMIAYQKKTHNFSECEGYVLGQNHNPPHVLLVHTNEKNKEEMVFDVKGTVYSVTFKEPVTMRFYAHWGYGKCKLPKCYLVKKEELKDYKIEKEEDVNLKATCRYVEEFKAEEDLDVAAELLQEFNAGIEEFNRWVRDLEIGFLKKELDDEQVNVAIEHMAMENILTDTVKTIFRKIGEFIAWFLRKLKDLWNYFFGKTQRATRALKAANEKINRHKNSNGFFNDGAFEAAPVAQGMINALGLDFFLNMGFAPDEFNNIFKEMLDMWADEPQDLYEEIFVKYNQAPTTHRWHPIVAFMPTGGPNSVDAMTFTKNKYKASGSMKDAGYDRDSVFIVLKGAMDAIEAYEKNSKLIASKGNISSTAARRVLEYQDRTDVTEQEAMQMAKDIQELANYLQVVFKSYQRAFEFILEQSNAVANIYMKYMK